MEKFFNTAGPCNPARHYMLPALDRPWLVNAIARECVEKIHGFRYGETITAVDIEAAKEAIIRKNPIHLDYLFDMVNLPNVRPYFDACLQGTITERQRSEEPFKSLRYLGFLHEIDGRFDFANHFYRDYWRRRTVGRSCMAIFDTDSAKPWEEKLYVRDVSFKGKTLHVVGL